MRVYYGTLDSPTAAYKTTGGSIYYDRRKDKKSKIKKIAQKVGREINLHVVEIEALGLRGTRPGDKYYGYDVTFGQKIPRREGGGYEVFGKTLIEYEAD